MKIIPRRRRAEGRTNYLKRKKLLTGRKPRVVIRKSSRFITVQFVESKAAQDHVKYTITSKLLLKHGWPKEAIGSLKSLSAGYLTGIMFGKMINKEKPAILDMGLVRNTPGSRIYAVVKGIVEAGGKIAHNPEVFPTDDRIKNQKIKGLEEIKGKLLK